MVPTPSLVTPSREVILQRLSGLAIALGAEVRVEPFGLRMSGIGGLCRIAGRPVIFVDAGATLLEQIGVLGASVAALVEVDGTGEIPPDLLPYVRSGHAPVGRLLRPRPLARGRRS